MNLHKRYLKLLKKREGLSFPQVTESKGRYRGRMLRADDPMNLFVGDITTCCQHIGGVGETSMLHASLEQNGGIFAVERINEDGKIDKIVGQSWVWRNRDTLCFDNVEINDNELKKMSQEELNDILEIYMKAGKKAIDTDKKTLEEKLKKGEISQDVYDKLVLKQVTTGGGYSDLLRSCSKAKELEKTQNVVLPKEIEKRYNNEGVYTDADEKQYILAEMDKKEKEEIGKRQKKTSVKDEEISSGEEKLVYRNSREVVEEKANKVYRHDVAKIKEIENEVYRDGQKTLQDCENSYDMANAYGIDFDQMEVAFSKDYDWYMVAAEEGDCYHIVDLAMKGGVNSQGSKNPDSMIATCEMYEVVYKKMIEMAEKSKKVRCEATRDTSYLNIENMVKKGLVEITKQEYDTFEDTDIEMENIDMMPIKEKLEEELERIKDLHKKLTEKRLTKQVAKKQEDEGR